MPKAKKGTKRFKRRGAASEQTVTEVSADALKGLSRGQRKRTLRKQRFLDKLNFVNVVSKAKEKQSDFGLGGFSSLADELRRHQSAKERTRSQAPAAGAKERTAKPRLSKTAVVEQESELFKMVIGHHSFKAGGTDAVQAIQRHLTNKHRGVAAAGADRQAARERQLLDLEKKRRRATGEPGGKPPQIKKSKARKARERARKRKGGGRPIKC